MADENTIQDNPAPEVKETPKTPVELPIRGTNFAGVQTEHTKGKAKGKLAIFLTFDKFDDLHMYDSLATAVGAENWNKCIYSELIRKACNDATHESITESGDVSDVDWGNKFAEWFLPATRRSDGGGIKALREQQQEIMTELTPVLPELAKGNLKPGTPEHMRVLSLLADLEEVNSKIETKSRKGKKAKEAAK